jgi:hypothetical protein
MGHLKFVIQVRKIERKRHVRSTFANCKNFTRRNLIICELHFVYSSCTAVTAAGAGVFICFSAVDAGPAVARMRAAGQAVAGVSGDFCCAASTYPDAVNVPNRAYPGALVAALGSTTVQRFTCHTLPRIRFRSSVYSLSKLRGVDLVAVVAIPYGPLPLLLSARRTSHALGILEDRMAVRA